MEAPCSYNAVATARFIIFFLQLSHIQVNLCRSQLIYCKLFLIKKMQKGFCNICPRPNILDRDSRHTKLILYISSNTHDSEYYGLSRDYLMGLTENKNHPNTSLHELHLNDSTVDLLKSGALNNRLLCEFVCHPGFLRLLTDMEVCIDRIADMRIHDMN